MNSDAGKAHRGRILVVDDEEVIANLLQKWLATDGYYTRMAIRFSEVQDLLVQETFDLVTLDITMPDVDGLQVLRWLKEHYPEIGVVMATARGDADSVIAAMRLGAYDYLIKPFNLDLVGVEIEQAMERQRLVAENRAYQQKLEQKVTEQTRTLQEANARLEAHVRELEGLERLLRFYMSYHTVQEARVEVLEVIAQVLEVEQLTLYYPASQGRQLRAVAAWGWSRAEGIEDEKTVARLPALSVDGTALAARSFRKKRPYAERGEMAIPLVYQTALQGILWVKYAETERGEEEIGNLLWRFGQEATLVLWSAQVMHQIEQGQVLVDDLLNLGNDRHA